MSMISSLNQSKDKQMKNTSLSRVIALVSVLLALASCAPQAFVIRPEMRSASKSGLNLAGKTMAVVYLTEGDTRLDEFNASMVNGFANKLEDDYFGGNQVIELFKMERKPFSDYSAKDSLVHLVMESGKDVVFLFDVPGLGEPIVGENTKLTGKRRPADSTYVCNVAIPFSTKVYVYDSMNKDDKVLAFNGSKSLAVEVYNDGKTSNDKLSALSLKALPDKAMKAGELAAKSFLSTWTPEYFQVIYYEGSEQAWDKGARYAYNFEWDKAIEQWLTLVNCKGPEKRACAAYNIALGCFMTGQPGLALEWLDRSDKDMPVSLSKILREKIKQYTGR